MIDHSASVCTATAAETGRQPHWRQREIADWLGSSDLRKLLEAVETLDAMGQEADEVLQGLLRRDLQRAYSGKRKLLGLVLLAALLGVMAGLSNAVYPGFAATAALFLLLPVWLATPLGILWYDAHRTSVRRLKHAAVLLERRPSLAAVGALTETMALADDETSFQAAVCLSGLLPRLTSADSALLDERQRGYLHRALRGSNSTLILAALDAFEKIGDARDIRAVQRLTRCPEWLIECYPIRARAQACLTILEARAAEQRAGGTFLRAAAPTGDSLLRAAQSTGGAEPQQLLRAFAGKGNLPQPPPS